MGKRIDDDSKSGATSRPAESVHRKFVNAVIRTAPAICASASITRGSRLWARKIAGTKPKCCRNASYGGNESGSACCGMRLIGRARLKPPKHTVRARYANAFIGRRQLLRETRP